jgi:hypothetical protein
MSDSTSILDLPTDPVGGGNVSNNISLTATENNIVQPQIQQLSNQIPSSNSLSLDQTTISQIVNGLQQASISGITQLSSRDIPMNTTSISTDPQIQPNYIPPTHVNNIDYIKNYEDSSDIVNQYEKNMSRQNSIDEMYNEIQTPFLLIVLYFLFQLPIVKKILYSYFPVLFSKDGNLNLNGLLFTSILFGLIFYILNKITEQFAVF